MKITINAKEKKFTEKSFSVSELLTKENVQMPEMVSVELNGTFLDRSDFSKTLIKDGDVVEFLYFMGGGV